MKQIAAIAIAATLAFPAWAEEGNPEIDKGLEMMSEAFRLLMDGLSTEMEPLGDALSDAWQDFVEDLGDLQQYEAPERLPNGDILIRRKAEPSGTEL